MNKKNMILYNVQWLRIIWSKHLLSKFLWLFLSSFSSIFFFVQNEMDDWEEHEELRAIEGLEGKFCHV